MKAFLKEYWLWIVIPVAVVLCALVVAMLVLSDESSSPFQYNIY